MTKLLVCTAGPEKAEHLVKEVVSIAESFDASVTVLNVLPHHSNIPSDELGRRGRKATKIIGDAIEEGGLEAEHELRFAEDVSEGIAKTSEEVEADMIIMGVGEKPGWLSFVRKDVVEQVTHKVSCPVLVLPEVLERSPFK